MALPTINDLKMWVGTLFTKDDWDYNFSQLVSWLAGGTSDLVVNSIKATNGLDMDGAQIINVGAATSGSQAVNLDQATTLLNRTSYYTPFTVASGKVDSNGNAAYLRKDSDTQVTVLAGNVNPDLVCIQSDGTVESVTSNTVLTVPATNGIYFIVKEKEQAITITTGTANTVLVGKKFPSTQNTGDYFLDNSTIPFKGYKYGISGWVETSFCYLGYVIVSGGVATVTGFNYNYNFYDVNTNNQAIITATYVSGTSGFNIYSNGYCEQWGKINVSQNNYVTVSLLKTFANTDYCITSSPVNNKQTNGDYGSSYGVKMINSSSFKIYSAMSQSDGTLGCYWKASGYLASGQY